MILTVIGRPGKERSAVTARLGAHLNAVVVDSALELAWERETATRGPDLHDVLAGRASPIEAVDEDGPVSILPCGRPLTAHTELLEVLEDVECEYGTVLIDCPPTADNGVLAASQRVVLVRTPRTVADPIRVRGQCQTLAARIVAVALCRADTTKTTIERLERRYQAPVTPIPGVPSTFAAVTRKHSVERAFRWLAGFTRR